MNSSQQIISPGQDPRRELALSPGQALMTPADSVDLSGSLSFFRRRLGLILLITAIAVCIGAAITFTRPIVYSAEATVSLEAPPEDASGSSAAGRQAGPAPNSAYVDTQVEILEARALAERVAEALGALDGKSAKQRADIISGFQSSVSAERSGESYALRIYFDADNGADAARGANMYAEQFTKWEVNLARDRNKDTTKVVASRLEELRQQAHADTEALQRYRIANGLLSTSGASLTEQEISSYNQAVTTARAEAAESQARLATARAQLRSGSVGDDVGEALGSGVIGSLRAREAQVGGQVANFETRYGPNYPQLVQAKGELAEIRRQIQSEIKRIMSNLEAQRDVANQRLASLNSSLGAARGKLAQNNAAMVGLDELERKAQASQALYETYLNSFKQLVAEDGTERPNARILSLAEAPLLPSSPNIPMNMVLALVIGLGAGVAAAYCAEALFRGISTAEEIEYGIGHRYLGSIPLLSSVSKMRRAVPALNEEPRSAFAESFRSLRTSIEQAVYGPAQVIAVTSALPKEGKTTVSTCLAQTLALSGKGTVLLDCDLRGRGVSRLLRLAPDHPGLIEVLEGKASLQDALVSSEDGLSVLALKPSNHAPELLLTSEPFLQLVQELRGNFEYIVLDLPPILPVASGRTLAVLADATVMVVRWRRTLQGAVRAALNLLPADRVNVVGLTINQIDMRRRRLFGHEDPAYFYRQYKEYYA
ncbi:GumC family protein [Novosphingobium beihaiensis]|uniref:non-specific protein-tyrosine kinase n=1 Tax=Novosphingobium beihaiensis TaxID=2930389 RepID=A0ABT0BTM5_9SPHN|nr:Wzz/FepE/Etk N-terminal domain-containing protein [Novosphingobium beihaiensis]MCJ2188396.1 Wzz/FepE/Etk N-terminal domain-containing protein [Novosphingobium beihaiensis]